MIEKEFSVVNKEGIKVLINTDQFDKDDKIWHILEYSKNPEFLEQSTGVLISFLEQYKNIQLTPFKEFLKDEKIETLYDLLKFPQQIGSYARGIGKNSKIIQHIADFFEKENVKIKNVK